MASQCWMHALDVHHWEAYEDIVNRAYQKCCVESIGGVQSERFTSGTPGGGTVGFGSSYSIFVCGE